MNFKDYIKKLFTKKEYIWVGGILLTILFLMVLNFQVSERKSRDSQRKQDVRDIASALESYKNSNGSYPLAENGMIVACDTGKKDNLGAPILKTCEWGADSLENVSKPKDGKFLVRIPIDPKNSNGIKYLYISDGRFFQLFAALEGAEEAENDPAIIARNLTCGNEVCNFGLASSRTPLDKSLEEYENELDAKSAPTKK